MDAVRWSHLKFMSRSPEHYRHAKMTPCPETAVMRVGAFVHALVLKGDREFVVWNGDRRGKAWEAFRDEQKPTATVMNRKEADLAYGAAEAVTRSPLAMSLLAGALEKRITWRIGARACVGTPDAVVMDDDGTCVTELKCVPDAGPNKFPWHAMRQLWDAQLAWYANGLGISTPALRFVAVEQKPPHAVACYALTGSAIESAIAKWRGLFERLMVCEASDQWPGYCESLLPFEGNTDVVLEIEGEEITL